MLKVIKNKEYIIIFNQETGVEILSGINGYSDPFKLKYPSMLDIGIMGHCLNNCHFCYQGDGDEPNMSLDLFKKIIDESKDYTNQCALGGRGDPNLHENFEEILKYARESGIVPNYTTSGNGLTQEQINVSREYCGAVAVSDYGTDHTFKAIRDLMDSGVKKVNIHFIFSRGSAAKCQAIIDGIDVWGGKVDIDRLNAVIFLLFKPQGRGKKLNWEPTKEQLEMFSMMIQSPSCKFKIGMDSCLVNKVSECRPLTPTEELFADTCEGGRMSCYISPSGLLIPCSFGDHKKYGRDITKYSIESEWQTALSFRKFRSTLKDKPNVCPFSLEGW